MFKAYFRWRMSPLGKELLDALERGDTWRVSKDGEDWEHEKSGIVLWNWSHMLRVGVVPNTDITDGERRRLLNVHDQVALKRTMKKMVHQHKTTAAEKVLNLLRLSQHKENQP